MSQLEQMNIFTRDSKREFLENLIFNDAPRIQNIEGFESLNLEESEQVICFVKQYKISKGFAILQNFINAMISQNVWNSYAFLEVADKLSTDEESNELLFYNCIAPLTKAIFEKNFCWDNFKVAYAVKKDVIEACKIFELENDEISLFMQDLQNGSALDFSLYRIKKYDENAVRHAERFKNIEDYEKALKMKFFNDYPEEVEKYIGRVPNGVLSVILVFKKAQEDLTPLAIYDAKFNDFDFWEKSLGFTDEIITGDSITPGSSSNVLIMYQILHGAFIDHYGNEPIKNIFMEKVYRFKREGKVPPFVARKEPLSDERSVYIINADRATFRFCESSIPYLLGRIEHLINSFNRGDLKDCKMDWRAVNGHPNITLRAIYFDTKEFKEANDKFTPYSIRQILELVSLDTLIELLHNFTILGSKVNCYDPILLIAMNVLIKSGFDVTRWCQAYITDPLMFAFCFNRAISAYLMGAEDYINLFNYKGEQWFNSFKEISFMIREHYNLAATCFNYLLFKSSKLAEFQEGLLLDFEFPHSIVLRGKTEQRAFDLYEVLDNPAGYANLMKKMFLGDVKCAKDSEGRLIVTSKVGGDAYV